jgi:hypothetical protein
MAAQILTVVCAWCNRTIVYGPKTAAITHTICPSCVEWTMDCRSNPDAFYDKVSAVGRVIPADYFGNVH